MDTKDPVWDDDESAPSTDGFRPRTQPPAPEPPASQQATQSGPDSVLEPVAEPAPHLELPSEPESPSIGTEMSGSESAPELEPTAIPVPGADRVRIEPVDSFRRPEAGGSRAARDRRQRSSTSMVLVALILFLISVISIGVYLFSRAADSDSAGVAEQVEFIDQAQQVTTDSSQQVPASQDVLPAPAPEQPPVEQTPPPPPPPGAGTKAAPTAASAAASGRGAREQSTRTTAPAPDLAESQPPRVVPEPEPAPKPKPEPAPKPIVKPKPEPAPKAPSKESVREQTPSRNSAPAPSASLKTTKSSSSAGAQWVIQVHSSPSVDDADEWLRQLQSRNVGDGRIEPVTQQGKVWYRVRFGRYATREEAEQAALQLGYRNAWIDRVR